MVRALDILIPPEFFIYPPPGTPHGGTHPQFSKKNTSYSSFQILPKHVVRSGIPGLQAVPDLVPIHPILPPTVHIHLQHSCQLQPTRRSYPSFQLRLVTKYHLHSIDLLSYPDYNSAIRPISFLLPLSPSTCPTLQRRLLSFRSSTLSRLLLQHLAQRTLV